MTWRIPSLSELTLKQFQINGVIQIVSVSIVDIDDI